MPMTHGEAQALLPEYVTLAALGRDPAEEYPALAAHVVECVECGAELDELMEVTLGAFAGGVPPAPSYPAPNLAFLGQATAPPARPTKNWLVDEFGRLLINFSEALLDALRQPALAGAARGYLYSYHLPPGPGQALDVRVEVFAAGPEDESARVRVAVDDPAQPPLGQSGRAITLSTGNQSWQGLTDEAGYVEFAGIARDSLPRLQVQVEMRSD